MCPEKDPLQLDLEDYVHPPLPWEAGWTPSNGATGEPSRSGPGSVRLVRQHQGLSTISAGSLIVGEKLQAIFSASKGEGSDEYMVTLSCVLTSTRYAALVAGLETTPGLVGTTVSVGVKFEPTTPNSVQPSTAPST